MSLRKFAVFLAVSSHLMTVGAIAQTTTSPSDCADLWKQADKSSSGSLTQQQAFPFVSDFASVDTDKDKKISNAEFMKGCSSGHVHKAGAVPGSTGSNSGSTNPKMMLSATG